MAKGSPPWSEYKTHISAMFQIAVAKSPPAFPSRLSLEAQSFLEICFRFKPTDRLNAKKLLKHPLLTSSTFTPSELSKKVRAINSTSDHHHT